MSEPVVETQGLTLRFGGVLALDNLSVSIGEGELRCLVGPNGAGKSTLFKCLTGQYRTRRRDGRVRVLGHDVTGWRPSQIVRLGVGIKTQVPSVMNGLSVFENLWLACRQVHGAGSTAAEVERLVDELGLAALVPLTLDHLSHGQRQVVEIAMALAQGPRLVLLDEPAAGIAPSELEGLIRLIRRVHQRAAVVVVDHDMQFVRELGGRVTVLHQGAILAEGLAATVFADPTVREVYIGNKVGAA
jgi:branched-chain amino acid transport system ATP-binding protein